MESVLSLAEAELKTGKYDANNNTKMKPVSQKRYT